MNISNNNEVKKEKEQESAKIDMSVLAFHLAKHLNGSIRIIETDDKRYIEITPSYC